MTREEAIAYWKQRSEHIHNWLEENEDVDFIGEYVEAIDTAIEALSEDTIPIEKYHELQHQFVMLGATFADLTEVVRCKDCRASRVYGKTTQWLACESVMEGQATDPNGYCYLAERKEP